MQFLQNKIIFLSIMSSIETSICKINKNFRKYLSGYSNVLPEYLAGSVLSKLSETKQMSWSRKIFKGGCLLHQYLRGYQTFQNDL